MDKPAARRYQGDFVAWTGVCGFIGQGGGAAPIAPHAHYAIELVIGAPRVCACSSAGVANGSRVRRADSVAARRTASTCMRATWSVVLFIEPETPEGKALRPGCRAGSELLDADTVATAAARLEHAWRVERSQTPSRQPCMQLVQEVSRTAPREPSDPRVLAAVEAIRQRVDRPVSLSELAKAAKLSPDRFRHLFVEQTGMPLRTYLLWRRLLHVWTLPMDGETLSGAAHAAGFADSAHLSRTARTMFGLPPSVLQMTGPLSARRREQQPRHGA